MSQDHKAVSAMNIIYSMTKRFCNKMIEMIIF